MQLAILYIATAVTFLVVDAIMLRSFMAPLFERHIGAFMLEDIRFGAAVLFYLFYVAGLIYLVSWQALQDDAPLKALVGGAILGAVAYGTYEFTSFAIMKNWSPLMVAADTTWGAVLTGGSAWAGVTAARALS